MKITLLDRDYKINCVDVSTPHTNEPIGDIAGRAYKQLAMSPSKHIHFVFYDGEELEDTSKPLPATFFEDPQLHLMVFHKNAVFEKASQWLDGIEEEIKDVALFLSNYEEMIPALNEESHFHVIPETLRKDLSLLFSKFPARFWQNQAHVDRLLLANIAVPGTLCSFLDVLIYTELYAHTFLNLPIFAKPRRRAEESPVFEGLQFSGAALDLLLDCKEKEKKGRYSVPHQLVCPSTFAPTLEEFICSEHVKMFFTFTHAEHAEDFAHFSLFYLEKQADGSYKGFIGDSRNFPPRDEHRYLFRAIREKFGEDIPIYTLHIGRQMDRFHCSIFTLRDILEIAKLEDQWFSILESKGACADMAINLEEEEPYTLRVVFRPPPCLMRCTQTLSGTSRYVTAYRTCFASSPIFRKHKGVQAEERCRLSEEAQRFHCYDVDQKHEAAKSLNTSTPEIIPSLAPPPKRSNMYVHYKESKYFRVLVNALWKRKSSSQPSLRCSSKESSHAEYKQEIH